MPPAFGGYQVLHQLGSGTLGPVFRAQDPATHDVVAVKTFKLDLLPQEAARLVDALQALAAAQVTHSRLATPVAAGLEDGTPYLITRYITGQTLDVVIRSAAPVAPDAAIGLLGQIADALDVAWTAGVGHGLLHPRDIFVLPDRSTACLTGVGLAWALVDAGIKVPVRRPYTAPERVAAGDWDSRADVFGLAAIAHELMSGRRPVGAGPQNAGFAHGVNRAVQAEIAAVLARGLDASPAERYGSAGAFVSALRQAARAGQLALPIVSGLPDAEPDADPEDTVYLEPSGPADLEDVSDEIESGGALDVAEQEGAEPESAETETLDEAADEPLPDEAVAAGPSTFDIEPDEAPVTTPAEPVLTHAPLPSLSAFSGADAGRSPGVSRGLVAALVVLIGVALGSAGVMYFGADTESSPDGATDLAVVTPAPAEAEAPAAEELPAEAIADAGDTEVAVTPGDETPPPVVPTTRPSTSAPPPVQRAALPLGRLEVTSRPSGALLMVDGRLRGETPVTLGDVPLGEHTIQVARPGFAPSQQQVTLTPGSPSRALSVTLQAGLEPVGAARGELLIESRPRGARVWLDGRPVGLTPIRVSSVGLGRHRVQFELVGHRSVSTTVEVGASAPARVGVTLEPQGGGGRR